MTIKALKPANSDQNQPSREEAEKAVETLLRYIGEDPAREGLIETPARFVRAFDEFFAGYTQDAADALGKTFEDIQGYDDFVLVRDIDFISHCEHHIVPIIGRAHVAYWPDQKIVGISKLARVVDIFARRLTSQETMSQQIAKTIDAVLGAKGTAVVIEADHQCMSTRGASKQNASTVTSVFTGVFQDDETVRRRMVEMIKS